MPKVKQHKQTKAKALPAQGAASNVSDQQLQLRQRAICLALKLPETATDKEIVDALMHLSDAAHAGRTIAEALSQEWANASLETVSVDSLVKRARNMRALLEKLQQLAGLSASDTFDDLYVQLECMATHGRSSYIEAAIRELLTLPEGDTAEETIDAVRDLRSLAQGGMALVDGLCAQLALPPGTRVDALIAAVKNEHEMLEKYRAGGVMSAKLPHGEFVEIPVSAARFEQGCAEVKQLNELLGLQADGSTAAQIEAVKHLKKRADEKIELRKKLGLTPDATLDKTIDRVEELNQQVNNAQLFRHGLKDKLGMESASYTDLLAAVTALIAQARDNSALNPTAQVMTELREMLGLPAGAHPAVVGSKVQALVEKLKALIEPLNLDLDASLMETSEALHSIIDIARMNREENAETSQELDNARALLSRARQEQRATRKEVRKLAALGAIIGELSSSLTWFDDLPADGEE